MICFTPSVDFNASARRFRSEDGFTTPVCQMVAFENPPATELMEFRLDSSSLEHAEAQPSLVEMVEESDWSDPKVRRKFIGLEQKVLADKASEDEVTHYRFMKSEWNAIIFADRYVSDYAEIQRIKVLSEKIADLQKYLRPIKMG